jgi:hypothetical protein
VRSQLQKALRWQYLGGPVGSLGYDVRMRPTQSNTMYVSDAWAGVFRSADGGPTWTPRNGSSTWVPANDALSQEAHVFGLVVHPSKAFVVYTATYNHGVLMSDNNGQKWQLRNPTPRQVTTPHAICLAMNPQDPQTLYLGLDHAGLYHTTDGGASWQPFMSGSDPNEPRIIHAADTKSGV